MTLSDYTVEWDGQVIPIQSAILRIESGQFPDSLRISHRRDGTITISTPGIFGFHYIAERDEVPQHIGIGHGLHRTYASGASTAGYFNQNDLLAFLYSEFYSLEMELEEFRSRVRGKVQGHQREALRRMINREENRSGRHMPYELREEAAEMLGENRPVRGAFNVKKNFSRINTTLFQGGKKRKGRKTRKGHRAH